MNKNIGAVSQIMGPVLDIRFPEGQRHCQYQRQKKQQPEESEFEGLQVKEYGTPEEIHHQLGNKQIQSQASGFGRQRHIDPGRANAHQCEEKGPHHGKYPSGRRQWRLDDGLTVDLCAVSGDPARKSSDGFSQ